MRKVTVLLALLASASAEAGEPEITLTTPASIALSEWCERGEACDQLAADRAQAHRVKTGRNAQLSEKLLVERSFFQGEKFSFRFNCVR